MTPRADARAPPHAMRGEGALGSYLRLQDQIEPGIDPRGRAGRHQGGRIHLLDDGGAGETISRAQTLEGVDRRRDEIVRLGQPLLSALEEGVLSIVSCVVSRSNYYHEHCTRLTHTFRV